MVSCRAIALLFVGIMVNNAILVGLFVAFVMLPEEETESEQRYGYNYEKPEKKPTLLQTKLIKWSGTGIVRRILEYIPGFYLVAKRFDELSTVVHVVLDSVFLPFEAIQSIHLWFYGQISGRRCAKTVVDATVVIAGGIGGAALGASVGTMGGGPVGTIIGGIIGGLFGSSVANTIMSHLTERIFDLPKSIAVERAYDFLGLRQSASNYDVNQAFRRFAHRYHPDKRYGSEKLFMELQSNMQLITEDRKRTFRS